MKTQEEIEQLAEKQKGCSKEYCDSIDEQCGYLNGYIDGYTQCQEDIVKDFLLLIKEYKDKELPNCNKPFHYEAEISSGLDGLVNYIKKQTRLI